MTVAVETEGRGAMAIRITGVASTAAGGIGAVANPEGVDILILRTTLLVLTPSTGSANIDIGVGAAAATDATDIINALAMNGAITDKMYNGHAMQNTTKTEITAPALWTTSKYICFTGSATTVGLDAILFVEYVRGT